MKLQKVKPSDIVVPAVRVTAQFDEELYAQFRGSLEAIGQITPIIVYEVEQNLVLCDGLHRLQEALNHGDATIDAIVIPGTEVDVLTRNLALDHLRGKPSVSEMVKVITTLYQDYNLDPDQIAEKTFKNRDYVEKLIKIGTASPVVQEALNQGIIGVGVAYEVSRLPSAIIQEEVIMTQSKYGMSVKDVKERVDDVLAYLKEKKEGEPAAPLAEVPLPRHYYCEGCKVETDPRYLRPINLCPNCFGEVYRTAKARETTEVKNDEKREGG